jgi:hypothetical protein
MHCTVSLCVQNNVKLCFFSSCFAKEANVDDNDKDCSSLPCRVAMAEKTRNTNSGDASFEGRGL